MSANGTRGRSLPWVRASPRTTGPSPDGDLSGAICFTVDLADIESLVAYATAESFGA